MKSGDRVEKFSGDYTGPGTIEQIVSMGDGRTRYLVSHRIEGGSGTFLHIYSKSQIRPLKDSPDG